MNSTTNQYWDTSALVKRYWKESGSIKVDQLFSKQGRKFTCALTHAEIYATTYRIFREGFISKNELKDLLKSFENDWKEFVIIEFSAPVRSLVPNVSNSCSLKGADLTHICSALLLADKFDLQFVSADRRLLIAAEILKLKTINPQPNE